MKLKLFSIHDSKAAAFIQPFFSPTTATALRSFATAANDEATDFFRYGGDYTLFELGEFDQLSAKLETYSTPINLGLAISFVAPAPGGGLDCQPDLPTDITQHFDRKETPQ